MLGVPFRWRLIFVSFERGKVAHWASVYKQIFNWKTAKEFELYETFDYFVTSKNLYDFQTCTRLFHINNDELANTSSVEWIVNVHSKYLFYSSYKVFKFQLWNFFNRTIWFCFKSKIKFIQILIKIYKTVGDLAKRKKLNSKIIKKKK